MILLQKLAFKRPGPIICSTFESRWLIYNVTTYKIPETFTLYPTN